MGNIKWNTITREDILIAIKEFDLEKEENINPKKIFLHYNSKKYPAKLIRKLAYNLKHDTYITEDQFKGGSYTVKFFNKLGFDMEFNGKLYKRRLESNNKSTIKNSNSKSTITTFHSNNYDASKKKLTVNKSKHEKIKISGKNVLEQKNALQLILNKIFDGDLVNEKSFEWMKTPENPKKKYSELYESLKNYRGDNKFAKSNQKLIGCDFVSESNKIIIEYDERQHFTEARRISLLNYPDIQVYYDKNHWINASEDIQAVDNTPPNRDEVRAYYDSIRDIEAYNHGYRLIRIMHEEFDFERDDAYEYVEQLIKTNLKKPVIKQNSRDSRNDNIKSKNTPSNQKNALQLLLNKMFDNEIVCEKAYDWMKTPKNPKTYKKLYDSLKKFNKGKISAKNDYRLHCDFVSDSNKIIIEYDERSHFTEARRISLLNYPEIKFYYDKNKWIQSCSDIQAKINSKHNSDVNRAYYDSIRDIESYNHGYKLIRIKHGEFDFESSDAYEYLENLIFKDAIMDNKRFNKNNFNQKENKNTIKKECNIMLSKKKNIDLRIGMYIQNDEYKEYGPFKNKMEEIKEVDFDILVFPEFCYTPFSIKVAISDVMDDDDWDYIINQCLDLSNELNKAVVVSLYDKEKTYFSIFANNNAFEDETLWACYFKNTMTGYSFLGADDYKEVVQDMFPIITYKGYKIGLTICNDGNHAPFSRMYGLQDVDVLLNSSGGDVKYKKWYTYHKTRSIENDCFSLVTMGGEFKNKSYAYGFNPNGGLILPENIHKDEEVPSTVGEVYIYDLENCDMDSHAEKYINQKERPNKFQTFQIPKGNIDSVIKKSKKIKENIYHLKKGQYNIILIKIDGMDIFKPELVIPYLYDKKISKFKNKKYIIINKFERELDKQFYENYLSVVLKSRTAENYVTVILESENINKCYQPTNNHDVQVVKSENGILNLDIKRASGPEAIWTTKRCMKKEWRKGFEILVEKMVDLAKSK